MVEYIGEIFHLFMIVYFYTLYTEQLELDVAGCLFTCWQYELFIVLLYSSRYDLSR